MTPNSVTVVPGEHNAGQFTAYWEAFWRGRGDEIISEDMEVALNQHLERVRARAESTPGRMQPAAAEGTAKAIAKGKALGAKVMTEQADARARERGTT